MEWLKDHAYLASWLALPIAIIIGILQIRRPVSDGKPIHWTRVLFTFLCLVSFPIVITPTFDESARSFGRYVFSFTLGGLIMMRRE
jgi:hypothetical protein